MKLIKQIILIFLVVITLVGCGVPFEAGVSLAAALPTYTSTPTYDFAPEDTKATATPFQPVPPTAIITPTNTPLPTATPLPTSSPTPTNTPLPTYTPTATVFKLEEYSSTLEAPSGQMNILLLGADKRPGQKHFRTDTLILLTVNSKNGTISLTSFPRDLWVDIPGNGKNRINTAYTFGKIPLVAKTFKQNFGVKIDHYILVNFKNFKKIVDHLGGLEVKVGQTVSDYRAGKYVTVPKGKVMMDADDVLWYVRSRKTTNDFARNRRQQEVLSAIFYKSLSLDALKKAPEFLMFYGNNVDTDMKMADVLPWLPFAIRFLVKPQFNQYYIGPHHVYNWITPAGAMVLVPSGDAVMKVVRKSQNLK